MERIPPPKPRRNQDATCVKLLGQRLMARDFDRQVAEFQVRVAVLNGFTARGIPVTKVAGYLPANTISNTLRDAMLSRGLVTPERLRARGVR